MSEEPKGIGGQPEDTSGEPTSVRVYVRPLEVTVPVETFSEETPPAPPSTAPPSAPGTTAAASEKKTYWSTMTTRIEAETSIKKWSTPTIKTEEGVPPRPEDHPTTREGQEREGRVKTITPNYKLDSERPSHDLHLGKAGTVPEGKGDYKMSMRQEDYKLTVIDPKVRSNANMPLHTMTLPDAKKPVAGDFPSEHSKRSLVKLEPLETRRFKSVESRPITTSNYLTESVERHREMEASRLRQYLKAKESDANQKWNKPGWPGPKKDDESLRELETIKKSIETLSKAANQPPKTEELDQLGRRSEDLLARSRAHRADFRGHESDIVKQNPEPVPQEFKDKVRDMLESRNSVDTVTTKDHDRSGYVTDVSTATWQFSHNSFSPRSVVSMNGARDDILKQTAKGRDVMEVRDWEREREASRAEQEEQSDYATFSRREVRQNFQHQYGYDDNNFEKAVIRVQDDKPRGIMKRRELESQQDMMYPRNELVEHKQYSRSQSNVVAKPTVTETVQRFEETRRTEEVERRVQRKERRERRSRHHSSNRHSSGREAWDGYHSSGGGGYRSSSATRGYLPSNETYYRQETTRRSRDGRYEDGYNGQSNGLAHARYGSLSDSLRRGELKYVPNGEVRESYYRDGAGGRHMHKSYSHRDVFGGDDRRSVSSYRRGSQQVSPFVEFPPTLPRRGEPHGRDNFRAVSKSRSYADWDDANRAGFNKDVRRYDDDMSRLEAEFRDSLLMPLPNGNHHERDYRTEQIPGGYETYQKENRANSGRRLDRNGQPVDFSEATQEYNFKREQDIADRRR